ncbi:MAG TPA: phage holin family protein [Thermoanaerobaculia bacterium]|nr:phage holin family protein [Thermoanaerobaculia bacterium]
MRGWIEMLRGLGEALLEVLRAEVATLQEDLSRSGRIAGGALALFGVALILLFWILGLLIFSLVAVAAIWLPLWGASLVVLALFLAAAAVLSWIGVKRLKQVENPLQTFRRRVDDHLDWWQSTLLREQRPVDVEPVTVTAAGEEDEEDLP